MAQDFKWKSAKGLEDALADLTPELEKKILDQSARAGLMHYLKTVRRRIPVDNKDNVHLKKSLKVIKGKKTRNRVMYVFGITGTGGEEKDARKYSHIFEWGSRFVTGKRLFSKTFESEIPNMLDVVAEKIKKGLKKYGDSRKRTGD